MRQAVAAARGDVGLIEARMVRLRAVLADNTATVRAVLDGADTVPDMTGHRRQVGDIRGELSRECRRLAAAEQVLASRRVELAGAIKQRRSLDRLAQKRSVAGALAAQRRRQAELDDLHAGRGATAPDAVREGTA